MKYIGQTDYDHKGPSPKQGVILCNLGTPDAPQTTELRRYLKEFLSDPRVVEVPRLLWWIIYFIILRIRPRRSASSTAVFGPSPLSVCYSTPSRGCAKVLAEKYGDQVPVVLGIAMAIHLSNRLSNS